MPQGNGPLNEAEARRLVAEADAKRAHADACVKFVSELAFRLNMYQVKEWRRKHEDRCRAAVRREYVEALAGKKLVARLPEAFVRPGQDPIPPGTELSLETLLALDDFQLGAIAVENHPDGLQQRYRNELRDLEDIFDEVYRGRKWTPEALVAGLNERICYLDCLHAALLEMFPKGHPPR